MPHSRLTVGKGGAVRDLVIVGAGGLGRETAEAVRAVNAVAPTWNLLGFLDDHVAAQGTGDVAVLGPSRELAQLPDAMVVVCVGAPERSWTRQQVVARIDLPVERFATVI